MKIGILSAVSVLIVLCFVMFGCASAPEEPAEPDSTAEEQPSEEDSEPEQEEEELAPDPVPEAEQEEPQPEEIPVEEIPVEELPVEEPEQEETGEEDFVVSEEVFSRTFNDIEELIKKLNKIIGASNYDSWLEYLTKEYKNYYSDEETLRELSKRPILQKYNIRLTSLKDYFNYVVVPSRSDVRLDDLVFEDNNRVKAIMIIEDQRVILYQLEKVNDEWKIGI
jgi:hypothetical protein